MNRHGSSRSVLALGIVLAAALVGLAGCSHDDGDGLYLDFMVPADLPLEQRPDTIHLFWLRPDAPGSLHGVSALNNAYITAATTDPTGLMGTVFVGTEGPAFSPRLAVAVGLINGMNGTVVSGGTLLIPQIQRGRSQRLAVLLAAPLPEDPSIPGQPQVVSDGCLAADPTACTAPPPPGDGGTNGDAAPGADAASVSDGGADHAGDAVTLPVPDAAAADTAPSLATGLVGYWKFDDNAGKVVKDSSGQGNNGMFVGTPAWMPGKFGGALDLTSTAGNGVVVQSSPSLDTITKGFTIAAWTSRAKNKSGLSDIVSRRAATMPDKELFSFTFIQSGALRGYIDTEAPTPAQLMTGTDAVALNAWVHVALTYDGTSVRIYSGGVEQTSTAYTQPITGGTPLCLGCGLNSTDNSMVAEPLGGLIDDLALYNRGLSAAEIKQLAAGGHPLP